MNIDISHILFSIWNFICWIFMNGTVFYTSIWVASSLQCITVVLGPKAKRCSKGLTGVTSKGLSAAQPSKRLLSTIWTIPHLCLTQIVAVFYGYSVFKLLSEDFVILVFSLPNFFSIWEKAVIFSLHYILPMDDRVWVHISYIIIKEINKINIFFISFQNDADFLFTVKKNSRYLKKFQFVAKFILKKKMFIIKNQSANKNLSKIRSVTYFRPKLSVII